VKRDGQDAHSPALATDACHDCRQQHVDPAARTEVQHFLTLRSSATAMGYRSVVDLQDRVTRWTSPSREGAKSDLESARNVLILKWLPHDF
jgi:hypothetical protein